MKVTGPGSSAPVTGAGGARPSAGGGFVVSPASGAAEAAGLGPVSVAASVGSLDALMALQGAGDPLERRRRAVRRAGRLLDVLDEVKIALLDGGGGHAAALQRLRGAVGEARDGVEDPGLTGVLDEIETRAAVEIAKQEAARAARSAA